SEFELLQGIANEVDFDLFAAMAAARKNFTNRQQPLEAASPLKGTKVRAEIRALLDKVSLANKQRSPEEAELLSAIDALWAPEVRPAKQAARPDPPVGQPRRALLRMLAARARSWPAQKRAAEEERPTLEAERERLRIEQERYEAQERERRSAEEQQRKNLGEAIGAGRYRGTYSDAGAAMGGMISGMSGVRITECWI